MSCLRLSFTDRRRARLARKFRLEQIEPRSLITDPLSLAGLSMGLPAVWGILGMTRASLLGNASATVLPAAQGGSVTTGQVDALAASQPLAPPLFVDQPALPLRIVPAAGFAGSAVMPATGNSSTAANTGDWLTLMPQDGASNPPSSGFGANWKPAPRAQGQLVVLGGSNGGSAASAAAPAASRGAISKLSFDPPLPSSGATAALMAAVSTPNNAPPPAAHGYGPTPAKAPAAQPAAAPAGGASAQPMAAGATVSGGAISPTSIADPTISNFSPASLGQFPYFPVYVINYNNGSIMMPGAYQLGTWSTGVDLRAQVEGTTVSSISWSTSGLVNAEDISGANTYDLKFGWGGTGNSSPTVNSVTLSVTDVNNHTETFTYDFLLPSGGGNYSPSGGGGATWPTSLAPNLELSQAPALASQNVSVDSTSGSLDTSINLPSYNPNVPALALTYDSLTADPRPIVEIPNALSSTLATPSQVSGQITVATTGGTTVYTGSTWYYNTSQFMPGDIQQIALQANMTGQSTGRYNYTATVVDYRTTNTTTTITGTETVLNQSTSAFGDGWNLEGLERITSASGGVILDLGSGGRTLWFTGSFGSSGGTYTDPPGEFSTLVENSGGGYTDTQTDGTQINFDSSGDETSVVNTNGLTTTLAWSGGTLNTITDPYHNITTFTYIGGYLQSIKDPANRITTFTHSGADLTGATLPDNSTWGYAYDSSGRLTQVTDPNSKTTTIAYDSAERASTITRPDGSIQTFFPNQEQGWTNTGTSGSPAAATLLALASSIYTDPNGNVTNQFPDWNGQGLTDVYIDALGNVSSYDRTSNGLATVTIDPLNRINQYTYDTHGNITQLTNPDLTTQQYSYNSFAEVTKYTDENNHTYTYTYDSHGNLLVSEDPLDNLTTMTYTPDGMLATEEDANKHTTDYSYDTQDRLTTVTNADGTTVLYGYNSQGNVTSTTNERGYTTTYSFDAMNRETGTTDALQDHTTFIYDSGGNLLVDEKPTPAGQTARTTSYSYDSMNRVVTVTAPMSQVTVSGYDSGGNLIKITDPMGRVTTISYDALNRPIVVTAPLTATTNAVTTTVYDADNEVIQVTDPMGRIRTTAYDNRGWVATVTDPLGNVTTYSYTNTGQISTQNNKYSYGNSIEAYYYDNDDRLTTFTDGMNDTTVYGYDSGGNETSVKDGNGNTTNYAYDSMNRLTTVTDALGHTTVYGYDSGGNQQTVTDGVGDVTTTLYDALNRATTIVDPRGDVTTIAYDVAGREVSLTDPNGNQTTWGYDAADRMTTMTDSLGHSATYVYNADDQLTDTTDRDGQRVTYSYDSGGQETGETWYNSSGGRTDLITSTYDADNELTSISDNYATLTFSYDSGGNQITAATSGPGAGQPSVTLTSGYDQDHDLTSIADNLTSPGLTTFQYDAAFRLTTITTSYGGTAGPQIVLGYDPGNRETSISRTVGGTGVSVNTTLAYDTANRLTTITDGSYTPGTGSGGGTSAALATYVYGYDNANRVTTEVDAEGTATFTYDSGGELLTARGALTENYSYDSGGNQNMSGYTTGADNEMTASPGYTYTYDKNGNMIGETQTSTGDVWTFGYDDRNRMTSAVEKSSGGTILNQATYTYDALNRRIGFDDNGTQTWTIYNGSSADANPYADFNGSGTLLTRYVSGLAVDELFARTSSGGTTAWYLTDRLGSVRDIVNSSGTVIDHVVYDSYGNILSEASPSNGDRFKFAGMEYDSTTGIYYDRARYYDSVTGRFLGLDPKEFSAHDFNLYRYVTDQPTDFTDPAGTNPQDPSTQPPTQIEIEIKLHQDMSSGGQNGDITLNPDNKSGKGGNNGGDGGVNPNQKSPRFPGGPSGTTYTPGSNPSPQNPGTGTPPRPGRPSINGPVNGDPSTGQPLPPGSPSSGPAQIGKHTTVQSPSGGWDRFFFPYNSPYYYYYYHHYWWPAVNPGKPEEDPDAPGPIRPPSIPPPPVQ